MLRRREQPLEHVFTVAGRPCMPMIRQTERFELVLDDALRPAELRLSLAFAFDMQRLAHAIPRPFLRTARGHGLAQQGLDRRRNVHRVLSGSEHWRPHHAARHIDSTQKAPGPLKVDQAASSGRSSLHVVVLPLRKGITQANVLIVLTAGSLQA